MYTVFPILFFYVLKLHMVFKGNKWKILCVYILNKYEWAMWWCQLMWQKWMWQKGATETKTQKVPNELWNVILCISFFKLFWTKTKPQTFCCVFETFTVNKHQT